MFCHSDSNDSLHMKIRTVEFRIRNSPQEIRKVEKSNLEIIGVDCIFYPIKTNFINELHSNCHSQILSNSTSVHPCCFVNGWYCCQFLANDKFSDLSILKVWFAGDKVIVMEMAGFVFDRLESRITLYQTIINPFPNDKF